MRFWQKTSLLLVFVTLICVAVGGGKVAALYCDKGAWGISGCHGFFTNGNADYYAAHDGNPSNEVDDVIEAGVYVSNATDFLNTVYSNLYAGANDAYDRKQMGAAFIVDGMLNYHNPSSRKNGIVWARNNWSTFATRVYQYANSSDSSYGVDWNRSTDVGGRNSAYFSAINDDAFHSDSGSVAAIYFYYPGGSFAIERSCANLIGGLGVPPAKSWNISVASSVNKTTVVAGQNVTWTHTVSNTGGYQSLAVAGGVYWYGATLPAGSIDMTDKGVSPNRDYNQQINAGATVTKTFTYTTQAADAGKTLCQFISANWTSSSDGTNQKSAGKCVTVTAPPPPASITCAGSVGLFDATTNEEISNPEPGESFKMKLAMSYDGFVAPEPTSPVYTMRIVGTSTILPNTAVNLDPATRTNDGITTVATAATSKATTGTYAVNWQMWQNGAPMTVAGGGAAPICPGTVTVAQKPYFRVYNGDANVYAAIDDCAATPQGTIRAFNKGGGGQYAGSGAQVAAIAAGAINGFISAAVNPGSLTTPTLLTFANTNGDPYGGTFGDQVTCVSDYWSGVTASSPTSYTEGGINMSAGQDKVVYVNGDAYITGSVTFATSGFTADTVPSYWLIATGNIYISNTVSQLDGVYAAKGAIYTCASAASIPDAVWAATNCGTQLRVNGAFIANQVKLLRTAGTLNTATANEPGSSTKPAEVFTFTPEVWLHTPAGSNPGASQYDAYKSLPPVL